MPTFDSTSLALTKIVATLGPASASADQIRKLIESGVSVFRLNFSHGTRDDHASAVEKIRAMSQTLERPVGILGDLQGPKIRIGGCPKHGIVLNAGDDVMFQRGVCEGSKVGDRATFSSTYMRLVDDLQAGERVLLNDGAIRMLVVEKAAEHIICSVTVGGCVTSGKGINLPESDISVSALSDNDREWVQWAVEAQLDFLALSFVRTADEIAELRQAIAACCDSDTQNDGNLILPIIAKIEHPLAVDNIDSILEAADGIMVARGDLGVEMELARVPVIQKQLVAAAQQHGKPVIVATQMLETMIGSPMPTRAEVSDVATAIFANVDAIMLSGETAVGKFPVIAVEQMQSVANHTERYLATLPPISAAPSKPAAERERTAALAHGAWTMAQDYGAKMIIVWSQLGGGARLLSQNNFSIPIIALSSDHRALRHMQLMRGIVPIFMDTPAGLSELTINVDALLRKTGRLQPGDRCLLIAGKPLGTPRVTNCIAIHEVGNPHTGFA